MTQDLFETVREDGEVILTSYRGHQKKLVLPEDVTRVGASAFRRCFSLEELIIPPNVRIIEDEAFNGCQGLRRIRFAEGLREISHRAFWCCSALTELTFPMSLRRIGSRAFECCSSLHSVHFKNEAVYVDERAFGETPYFDNRMRRAADVMRSLGRGQQGSSTALADDRKDLVLPEGLTHIDHWAFCGSTIRTLSLPNSLRTLGMCAFKDCRSLTRVSLSPNTYCNYHLTLGPSDGIFSGCGALEEVLLKGPLGGFVWSDADEPEILHGFDRERTFLHCRVLRRITAYEIPLSLIPDAWMQYALNGFLADPDRDTHYLPDIAASYHSKLADCREQLIRRAHTDSSLPLIQYLTGHRMITEDEIESLLARSYAWQDPEITAQLMQYKAAAFPGRGYAENLLQTLGDLI